MIETGAPLPDLTLPSTAGPLRLRDLTGPVVIYFYPKDDTPGCTSEARDFSALLPDFQAAGATVIGISPDSLARHERFAAKHGLTVVLASDADGAASAAFGTWVEKSLYGRRYMGIERASFLFDATGRLAHVWRKVRVKDHATHVLATLRQNV